MLNRRLHRSVIGGITGIVLFSVTGAWLLVSRISFFFAFICICMIVALAGMLVRKIEKTERQVENFFSAIRDTDFNVRFSEHVDDKFLSELYKEMNRIMMQFEGNQTQLEERRLYYESIVWVLTHEIRNSITPVASLSADLLKHTDEYSKEEMCDGLLTIHQQAQQLNTFLNAYHRLTHLPEPDKTKVEIRVLFDKLKRLLKSEKGSENIQYISPKNMEVMLDPNLITLALINLIRNALQATSNHPEPYIKVEAGRGMRTSFIQVTDNGEGIPQIRQEDIFIPFYSTKKEGSGVGLPLSRRIMHLHGGKLILNSDPGEKTVFQMIFPEY